MVVRAKEKGGQRCLITARYTRTWGKRGKEQEEKEGQAARSGQGLVWAYGRTGKMVAVTS